jgi:hypothetical protein
MRRGIGEIIPDQQVVGVATTLVPIDRVLADLVYGLTAGEAEEAVATVRHRVLSEDILIVLLECEDTRGVLPAVVHPMTVSAHAKVNRIAADDVALTPPQSDSPA